MLASKRYSGWTAVFVATTALTSATGYFFPHDRVVPEHVVGAMSLVVLLIALFALYVRRLATAPAPSQAEPPFAVTPGIVLLVFIVFYARAARSFRP